MEDRPVHYSLSAISPGNPVMLIHVSGHGVFVNELVLDRLGITDSTPDPDGGEIVRDARGHATGMLRETAQDLARAAYAEYLAQRPPEVIEAEFRQKVDLAGAEALAMAIRWLSRGSETGLPVNSWTSTKTFTHSSPADTTCAGGSSTVR